MISESSVLYNEMGNLAHEQAKPKGTNTIYRF